MGKSHNRLSLLPRLHGQWTFEGGILRSSNIPIRTTMENITIEQCIDIAEELGYRLWVEWKGVVRKFEYYNECNNNEGYNTQKSAFKAGLNSLIENLYDKKYPDAVRRQGLPKCNLYGGCRKSTKSTN